MTTEQYESYYVPEQSHWPIVGAVALFCIAFGAGGFVSQLEAGGTGWGYLLLTGLAILVFMIFGWLANVINESATGLYSQQLEASFRQGMTWFIFSEVMFFAAFFGALYYARNFSVPWLGGEGTKAMTNVVLWPEFQAAWPLVKTPDGSETQSMPWVGLPLINTILLLSSSVTAHIAHVALEQNQRGKLKLFMGVTIVLGLCFLFFQAEEYIEAYQHMNLRLDSGIYGSTFFMLTGFHGMHVTLGTIMLIVVFFRILKGHFTPESHFGFQAASWYWHFVDVVWVMLFLFVYIL